MNVSKFFHRNLAVFVYLALVIVLVSIISVILQEDPEKRRGNAIEDRLELIAQAGLDYLVERGGEEVSYQRLVDTGYLENPVKPVHGESYQGLVIAIEGGDISVTDADGRMHDISYE